MAADCCGTYIEIEMNGLKMRSSSVEYVKWGV